MRTRLQRRVAGLAMLIPVVLLIGCAGAIEDLDDRRMASRAGLEAIPPQTLVSVRSRKLASFEGAVGDRLHVVRSRDFLYADDTTSAAMYHEVNIYMSDPGGQVRPGCRDSLERLSWIPGAIATLRTGGGRCRFLVFHYQDAPFDTSPRRLASLYDVEGAEDMR